MAAWSRRFDRTQRHTVCSRSRFACSLVRAAKLELTSSWLPSGCSYIFATAFTPGPSGTLIRRPGASASITWHGFRRDPPTLLKGSTILRAQQLRQPLHLIIPAARMELLVKSLIRVPGHHTNRRKAVAAAFDVEITLFAFDLDIVLAPGVFPTGTSAGEVRIPQRHNAGGIDRPAANARPLSSAREYTASRRMSAVSRTPSSTEYTMVPEPMVPSLTSSSFRFQGCP